MAVLVQKYGGTSLGNRECIQKVVDRIAATKSHGKDLVVVVSAMAGETDRLLGLVHEIL